MATKRTQALFMSAFETASLGSVDYDAWEAAAKKAGIAVQRRGRLINVPRFKPLVDA